MLPGKKNEGFQSLFEMVIQKVQTGEPGDLVDERLRFVIDNSYIKQVERIEKKLNQVLN
jgi:hypothetical protein